MTSPQDGMTPAFGMALARVVVSWGGLEETLRAALSDLYRHPRTDGCRRKDVHTFRNRLDAWAEAIEWIEGDQSEAAAVAADVAHRASAATPLRNLLVHGCWPHNLWTPDGCKVFSFNRLDRGILAEAEVTTALLESLVAEIDSLNGIITHLMVSKMDRDFGQGLTVALPVPAEHAP
jgi:hypothetical protein